MNCLAKALLAQAIAAPRTGTPATRHTEKRDFVIAAVVS
jgi:hypothetical protein